MTNFDKMFLSGGTKCVPVSLKMQVYQSELKMAACGIDVFEWPAKKNEPRRESCQESCI